MTTTVDLPLSSPRSEKLNLLEYWSAMTAHWSYASESSRDLRIDFLRGLIMFIVITVHMEYFSLYSFLVWERVGVISSAEGFVALSGMVLGMVYGKKYHKEGLRLCANKMIDRSLQLYRVSLFVIGLIAVLHITPYIDAHVITQWVNPANGEVFPLFPSTEASLKHWVKSLFLLKIGPHQFQVMGLYVVLLAIAPLLLLGLKKGRVKEVLGASWILYIVSWTDPMRITGAQFEYAFPLTTWQLLFVHAFALGVFKEEVFGYFSGARGRILFWCSLFVAMAFWLFTLNNPNPTMPDWAKLTWLNASQFYPIYGDYFSKSALGIGRLANNLALFVVAMGLLTRFWVPIKQALGWLAIPIGQASLYVFVVHVFFVWGFSLTPWHDADDFWLNTLMHTLAIAGIWWMTKNGVLFRWIPR